MAHFNSFNYNGVSGPFSIQMSLPFGFSVPPFGIPVAAAMLPFSGIPMTAGSLPFLMNYPPQFYPFQGIQVPAAAAQESPAQPKRKTVRARTTKTDDEEYVPKSTNRLRTAGADGEWQEKLAALKMFQTVEGRLPLNNDAHNGHKIGVWAREMRNARHWLSRDRVKELEAVQGWIWEMRHIPYQTPWEDWCNVLRQFVAAYKYLPRYKDEWETCDGDEVLVWRVGVWSSNQRQARLNELLSEDQIAALDATPRWEWELSDWSKKIVWFTEFVGVNGFPKRDDAILIPGTDLEWKIGRWMNRQRLRRRQNKLSADQIELFEQISGWKWDVGRVPDKKKMEWDNWVELLLEYMSLNDNKMPNSEAVYVKDGKKYNLGQWTYNQRRRKRVSGRGIISQERIAKLEAVPGWEW